MQERVTIGVPVYRGEAFLEETLHSIQKQTYRRFEVLISLDGPDPVCEKICARFLEDSRFKLSIRPERLGWIGNLNWLLAQVASDFWYFHQQDDLTEPDYIEVLLEHARSNPTAALVYSDLVPIGRIKGPFTQPRSVRGATAFMRVMTLLHEHFPAFAFRGLTRAAAVHEAGNVQTNEIENAGVPISWLTGVARVGELLHVPRPLYRKRYHSNNTESKWREWPKEKQIRGWCAHCVNMLEQAMRIQATIQEFRMLWLAAVERLTSPRAGGHFFPIAELTTSDREMIFDGFIDRARASTMLNVPALLDAEWPEIQQWSRGFYWIPSGAPIEIKDFGPNPVCAGMLFNVQPNGESAVWVRISRAGEPGLKLQLGNTVLDAVLDSTLLTAHVPAAVTQHAGKIPLIVIGHWGEARSDPVMFEVLERK